MVDFAKLAERALRRQARILGGRNPQNDQPEVYDDPCCADEAIATVMASVLLPMKLPGPTGLSEEDDARVFMALRFNPKARVCPNCEEYYELVDHVDYCPRCHGALEPIGTVKMTRWKSV